MIVWAIRIIARTARKGLTLIGEIIIRDTIPCGETIIQRAMGQDVLDGETIIQTTRVGEGLSIRSLG
jgi:hypothetical protein